MIIYISKFISSYIMMFLTINIWHYLLNKKMKYLNLKIILYNIFLTLISIVNYYFMNEYLKIFSITIILIITFKFFFKESLRKSILTPLYTQVIVMISEMIFVVLISFIFNLNNEGIIETQFGQFFSNICISIIMLAISRIPLIRIIYIKLLKMTDRIKKYQLIVNTFIIIIIANVLVGILYFKIEFRYLLIINTLLTLFCLSIVLYSFITNNKYQKVYYKYNLSLNSLKEYEDILNRYKVINHENKNQLLTVRGMISKNNNKVISYIDRILENKIKDNEKLMKLASKIPVEGLRGLIYSKLLIMKEDNIKHSLQISKEVRKSILINIDDELMVHICQIIGVFLDNAIEATKDIEEKIINIDIYIEEDYLFISIQNTYSGIIELEKIEVKGYTTKSNDHGYGLTLAKELISKNPRLKNEKMIDKYFFTQILKIKL